MVKEVRGNEVTLVKIAAWNVTLFHVLPAVPMNLLPRYSNLDVFSTDVTAQRYSEGVIQLQPLWPEKKERLSV